MEGNIFEMASRDRVRFPMQKGDVTVEDLWILPLETVNTIAVKVDRELKDQAETSFISQPTKKNLGLQLQLEILKHVIKTRLDEKEAAKNKAANAAKIATLEQLLEKKNLEKMEALSPEEIEQQIAALKS